MDLKFQVQVKIQRPVAEVFDGVVNPKKLSGYFVQKASGPLREGTTVQWTFAEVLHHRAAVDLGGEMVAEGPGSAGRLLEQVEDLAPPGVGQRLEQLVVSGRG